MPQVEKYVDTKEADIGVTTSIFKLILEIGKKNKLVKMLRLILSWMLGEMHSNV